MKIDNLFQDPENDSEAPYADTIILDAGGMDVNYAGENLAHISFEGLDPFELAYHAMPDDWEHHEELNDSPDAYFNILTVEQHCENGIYGMLNELGKLKGWTRQ